LGLARVGTVAVDSTRVKANASPDKIEWVDEEREERARKRRRVRRWQKACDADDGNEGAGASVGSACEQLQQAEVPAQLRRLPKVKQSRTDRDSRFLRQRGGRFVLGYTGEIAVSQDHFIVAARVTQAAQDGSALVPLVEEVETRCRRRPQRVLADSGFYSNQNVAELTARGIDVYVPYPHLARELHGGPPAERVSRMYPSDPHLLAMREKLRSEPGKRRYEQRKQLVEPVFGILKEQRGMRQFRLRGLAQVNIEWLLSALAHNLLRLKTSG
jgi:hypothetical protein